ncbi:monocarboxylate transporter 4-like [Ciona intestinalis]
MADENDTVQMHSLLRRIQIYLKKRRDWVVVVAAFFSAVGPFIEAASFGTIVPSLTGRIGSLVVGLSSGVSPVSNILIQGRLGARYVGLIGVMGASAALVATSFVPNLYWMFLTYSVLFGTCFNFIINSGMVLVGAYFPNKNQALATGLTSTGISFGVLLSTAVSEVIVTRYGWRRRLQIFASIIFVIGIPCMVTFKPVIDYMEGIGIPSAIGAWVLTVYGVSSFVGRILGAVFGEKIMAYGSKFGEDSCRRFSLAYVYTVCSVMAGLVAMLTPQWKLLGVVYVYVIVTGCTTSVFHSVMFASTMQFFGDELGIDVWGYANAMLAIGTVTGPVASGAIYDVTRSYVGAFYMCGGLIFSCGFTAFILPIFLRHRPPQLEVMPDAVIRNDHVTDAM